MRKLEGARAYEIKYTSVDCGENEIATEIHGDAGEILTKAGSRAKIGAFGFLRRQKTEQTKNVEYKQGVDVSWVGNKSPRVPTSSYAGGADRYFTASTWPGC